MNAYMYYENAKCSGDEYISGKLIYEYDDETNEPSNGFTVRKYDGPCNYFRGGLYDFYEEPARDGRYVVQGYCIKCNGVIGCSQSKNSCSEFSSIPPPSYYEEDDVNGTYTGEAYDEYLVSLAKEAEADIYEQIMASNIGPNPRASELIGGAVSMVIILALLTASIKAVRILRKSNPELCNESLDQIDDSSSQATVLIPTFVV